MKGKEFRSPDGISWLVQVTNPGASNAIVLFRYPDTTARKDRYAWYLAHGPEARKVTARLDPEAVLQTLTERDLKRLFRSSYGVDEDRGVHRGI